MQHGLVKWIDQNPDKVQPHLPQGWTVAQTRRSALAMLQADKQTGGKIGRCTPESLTLVVLQAASYGLSLDSGDAYVIPYGDQATLSIGYRGMVKLAKKSAEILHLKAEVVYEGESFVANSSSDHSRRGFDHQISIPRSTGELVAVYVCIDRRDGLTDFEVMDRAEIDRVRAVSKSSNGPAWKLWLGEMAKKAVIRRALKRYTLSPEVDAIFIQEDDRMYDVGSAVVAKPVSPLNRRLGLVPDTAPSQTPEEAPSEAAAAASSPPDGASDGDSFARSLGQLLKGVSGPVDSAKAKLIAMEEGDADTWVAALREGDAEARGRMVVEIVGGAS